MEYLREYFRDDLKAGYEKKFETTFEINQTKFAKINRSLYSVLIGEESIVIHNYDENIVDLYYFDSKDPIELFTHYRLRGEDNELYYLSTVYRYENDHSILNSMGVKLVPKEGKCVNAEVFFAEHNLSSSPMASLVKILNKDELRVKDFIDHNGIYIDDKNPYLAIIKAEAEINAELKIDKARKR